MVNIRRRLNRKKKGNKIGARLDHILYLLFDSTTIWNGMEERRKNYDHTSAKDDDGEDDDLFWVGYISSRLFTFEERKQQKPPK